jgi:hypothetical protein
MESEGAMYVLAFEGADRSTGRRYVLCRGSAPLSWRGVALPRGCIYFFRANSPYSAYTVRWAG